MFRANGRGCKLIAAVLVCSVCVISVHAAGTPVPKDPETRIQEVKQKFVAFYNAGSAAGIASLLAEDAVWLPPGEPAVLGRDAIEARYITQFAKTHSDLTLNSVSIQVSGNLGWMRGEYQRIDTPVIPGAVPATILGKFVWVFRREGGDWKFASNTFNPNDTSLVVDAQIGLHGLRAVVENRLNEVSTPLKVIAGTAEVKSGIWSAMVGILTNLGNTGIHANAIWYVLPDGNYYTVEKGFTGLNLSERSYFPGLMAGHSVQGTLVISMSTGLRSVIIAEPVFNGTQVTGGVGVSYSVDQLSLEIDQQMKLPSNMIFYALDADGQTALHRNPALMFEYPSDMGSPTLAGAVTEMLSKDSGLVSYVYLDMRKTVIFEKSAPLDWVIAFGFSDPVVPNMR